MGGRFFDISHDPQGQIRGSEDPETRSPDPAVGRLLVHARTPRTGSRHRGSGQAQFLDVLGLGCSSRPLAWVGVGV